MKTAHRFCALLTALMLLCSCRVARVVEILFTPVEPTASAAPTVVTTLVPTAAAAVTDTPAALPPATDTPVASVVVTPVATPRPTSHKSFLPLRTPTPKPTRLTPSKRPTPVSTTPAEESTATPKASPLPPTYQVTDYGIEVRGYGYGYTLDRTWQPQELYGLSAFVTPLGMISAMVFDDCGMDELGNPDTLEAYLRSVLSLLDCEDADMGITDSRDAVYGGVEGRRIELEVKNIQGVNLACRLVLLPVQGGVCEIIILYPLGLSFLPALADRVEDTIGPR